MTEDLMQNKSLNKKKYPSKKKRRAIQNSARQRRMMEGFWKIPLYFLLALLPFAALAISISLGFFIMGFLGVVAIVKKEIPIKHGFIRGKPAVIIGLLTTVFLWGMAIYFFWVELTINWWGF